MQKQNIMVHCFTSVSYFSLSQAFLKEGKCLAKFSQETSTWIGVKQLCLLPFRIKITSLLFGHHIHLLKKRTLWLCLHGSLQHSPLLGISVILQIFFFLFGVSSLLLTPYLVLFLPTFLVCARGVSAVADPFPFQIRVSKAALILTWQSHKPRCCLGVAGLFLQRDGEEKGT